MAKLIDSTDSLILHSGTVASSANYHNGSVILLDKKVSQEIKFNFTGTSLSIFSQKNIYRSAGIAVDIDGTIHRMDQSGTSTGGPWKVKVFTIADLVDKKHSVTIYMDDETKARKHDGTFACEFDFIEIDDNAMLLPELSRKYEFPIRIGSEAKVEAYARTLFAGEEQLLITREGNLYLTDGNGGYKPVGNASSPEVDLSNYYNKAEVDGLIADINIDTTGLVKMINGTVPDENGEVTIRSNQIQCWDEHGLNKGNVHNYIEYLSEKATEFDEHITNHPTAPEGTTHEHENKAQLDKIGESANMLTFNGKVVVNNNEYSFRSLPRAKVVDNYSTSKGGRLPWLV